MEHIFSETKSPIMLSMSLTKDLTFVIYYEFMSTLSQKDSMVLLFEFEKMPTKIPSTRISSHAGIRAHPNRTTHALFFTHMRETPQQPKITETTLVHRRI